MRELGTQAGGEPPLPKRPDVAHLNDLSHRAGNDQLKAILDRKDQLLREIKDWQMRAETIAKRRPRWDALQSLLKHATSLPDAERVTAESQAIEAHRALLNNPDPVPGMVETLTQALRSALNTANARCQALQNEGFSSLSASGAWKQLASDVREDLTHQFQLGHLPQISVGSSDDVLATLGETKLQEWATLSDAIPTRFSQALAAAAKLLEPKAQQMTLPGGTIKNEDDLRSWLTLAENQIRSKLKDGPVILS